jgi:integrase/recombinase XerD
LPLVPDRDLASILIRGKGNKSRRCPLRARTVRELATLVRGRASSEHIFLSRCGRPITRFGIHALVQRSAARAAARIASLAAKRVSLHTIRHTTATHLLRAGVDINTIRVWLGHVSLATANVYPEVDLEMKAKALANCEVCGQVGRRPWRVGRGIDGVLADAVTRTLMWRPIHARFEGTGGRSGRRHISILSHNGYVLAHISNARR